MEEGKKPRSREKRVVSEGKGVEKRGSGLGTGPVGNTGGYQDRKEQPTQSGGTRPSGGPTGGQNARPFAQSPSTRPQPSQSAGARPAGSPTGGQNARPSAQSPFTRPQPSQSAGARPAGGSAGAQTPRNSAQSPYTRPQPSQSGGARPMNAPFSAGSASGSASSGTRSAAPQRTGSGSNGGGGGKILLIVAVLALLFGGGKLGGLFGGDSSSDLSGSVSTVPSGGTTLESQIETDGSSGTTMGLGDLSGSSGLTDLLSALLGSSSSSVYDYSGDPLSLLTGGSGSSSGSVFSGTSSGASSSSSLLPSSAGAGASEPDTTVAKGAREKFTVLKGKGKDKVTLLVYLCGTDLESQNGMGTSDLKEMASATLGKNINLIVFTGGCRRWRNNVVSNSVNQIYQIQDGKLYCLEKDMGSASMTSPKTLSSFIRYGAENFPANRMCLILWDHGGGSASGYGYDEKYSSSGSMSLAGINSALKEAGQKFDFIGFDACLMATVENGLMLSQYADYMIASEETEPGVGWYYTNWLTKLGSNTSLSTVEIGKMIADDFITVCDRQCRGQGTTLSVVDLAELQATVPARLSAFGKGTNELIQNQDYKTVSSARSKTREFAQSTKIDQIDLVHFAKNLGTKEGKSLVSALQSAVKYNRTGGSITNAYGLSIYFPYKRVGKLSQVVSTYQAIGMDEEYTRCIQEFASLELSGQAAAGTSMSGYSSQSIGTSSLLNSLFGGGYGGSYGGSSGSSYGNSVGSSYGGSSGSSYGSLFGNSYGGSLGGISSSSGDLSELLGGLFGGSSLSSSDDLFSIFSGRSMTADRAAEYLSEHHLDASLLVWDGNRLMLSADQWAEVESLCKNVFVDDGSGFIDLGMDSEFTLEGNALVDEFDGTWMSIDRQPVAYYYLGTEEDGENYVITGYVPALLNNSIRVNLMLLFDNEHPYGVINGAEPVYLNGETDACAKTLIQIGEGDTLQFLCDYYDYEGNYQDSYLLGKPIVLGAEPEIANTPVDDHPVRVTYCFTDYYQQRYWVGSAK